MWECCRGVGGAGRVFFWSKIGWRPSKARYLIDVVDQQMYQLHKINWAPYHKTVRTGIWVLDTGVTEQGDPLLGVSRKDGVTDIVGRVSGGNERGHKHKTVSASNANSRFCNHITLDGSTPEDSAIGFDMGIITYSMISIDGWRLWRGIITKYGIMRICWENRWEQADILEV